MEGRTPLHWAAYKNHTATLKLLLVMDARAEVTDEEGCTPLHWAAIKGNSDCATILLQVLSSQGSITISEFFQEKIYTRF